MIGNRENDRLKLFGAENSARPVVDVALAKYCA